MIALPKGCMGLPPRMVRASAAGIDVRPGSYDVVVGDVLFSRTTRTRVVRIVFVGKLRDESEALFVLRQYKTRVAVIDTRPEMTIAKRFQDNARKYGIAVWRAEYTTVPTSVLVTENFNEGLLKIDRTMGLDNVQHSFNTGLTIVIPQNYREILGGHFVSEMISSTRASHRFAGGKDGYIWEASGDDHVFHAMNYLLVAIDRANLGINNIEATIGPTRGMTVSEVVRCSDPRDIDSSQNIVVDHNVGLDWASIEKADEGEAAWSF